VAVGGEVGEGDLTQVVRGPVDDHLPRAKPAAALVRRVVPGVLGLGEQARQAFAEQVQETEAAAEPARHLGERLRRHRRKPRVDLRLRVLEPQRRQHALAAVDAVAGVVQCGQRRAGRAFGVLQPVGAHLESGR
jgi:hypothetical protein